MSLSVYERLLYVLKKSNNIMVFGVTTYVIITTPTGRTFHILGDIHVPRSQAQKCEAHKPELITSIMHRAFQKAPSDDTKIDFFFEKPFVDVHTSTASALRLKHWKQGKDIYSGFPIEKKFGKCFIPDKNQCKLYTPYGESTRFHYVDIRNTPHDQNDSFQTSALSVFTHNVENLLKNFEIHQPTSVSLAFASICRIVHAILSRKLISDIADGLLSNLVESEPDWFRNLLAIKGQLPYWAIDVFAIIADRNPKVFQILSKPMNERFVRQFLTNRSSQGIRNFKSKLFNWTQSRILNVEREAEMIVRRHERLFNIASQIKPNDKLDVVTMQRLSTLMMNSTDSIFTEIESVTIFDVYMISRIFKPSIVPDSEEVWTFTGTYHAKALETFILKHIPGSSILYIGVPVGKNATCQDVKPSEQCFHKVSPCVELKSVQY